MEDDPLIQVPQKIVLIPQSLASLKNSSCFLNLMQRRKKQTACSECSTLSPEETTTHDKWRQSRTHTSSSVTRTQGKKE